MIYCKTMIVCLFVATSVLGAADTSKETGFLVVAPDRGFMGNEELRDAFEEYRKQFNAALVFATREETERFLKEGLSQVQASGAKNIVVLPLFLSLHHPMWKHIETTLSNNRSLTDLPLTISQKHTGTYLISEILSDRLEELSENPSEEMLILVAQGARDDQEAALISEDIKRFRVYTEDRYPFAGYREVALQDGQRGASPWKSLEDALASAQGQKLRPVVIPLDFSWKADGMMSLGARLKSLIQKYGGSFDGKDLTPHPNVALWLAQRSNAHVPITRENLGVVFMPHGSNYNWNRRMMDALGPLTARYMIEPAFGMGDPVLIERGVRRLERRGARAVVVIRVFSLESSFREITEYVLGLQERLGHAGHGHDNQGKPPERIRTSCVLFTLGGIEASPLFAEALLDRVLEVSKEPKKETIILLAHGTDDEEANKHWERNLASIASHMQMVARLKARHFRDIQYATWREDWPELREKAIQNIRTMVERAAQDGGTPIVIPARTTRGGREEEWLKGLNYVYNGKGFAPHPTFERWVEEQILIAMAHFNNQPVPAGIISVPKSLHHYHPGRH
jgi:sirohydrochlorin ferrochelatase